MAVVDGVLPTSADVYRDHVQRVARWVSWSAGPGADVEDLVQEIFLRVHRLLPQFRGESQISSWLFSITQNVVRTRRRKERFRRLFSFAGDPDQVQVASQRPTPLEDLERRRSAETIYAGLDSLAEKYRQVLILFEFEGLSGEQIAALTGLKVETVWVRLGRARKQLGAHVTRLERKARP